MDQSVLVNMELQRGSDVVAALDQAKVKVGVAMFANLAEYDDWRLVLAARAFDELSLNQAYGLLFESLSAAGIGVDETPVTRILPMTDPFVKELRRTYAKRKTVEGMRLGPQLIGGRFVNDSYVYRIA